jgi:hypothetical protein
MALLLQEHEERVEQERYLQRLRGESRRDGGGQRSQYAGSYAGSLSGSNAGSERGSTRRGALLSKYSNNLIEGFLKGLRMPSLTRNSRGSVRSSRSNGRPATLLEQGSAARSPDAKRAAAADDDDDDDDGGRGSLLGGGLRRMLHKPLNGGELPD